MPNRAAAAACMQVLTIGATNLAQELDQALLRPGRFEVNIDMCFLYSAVEWSWFMDLWHIYCIQLHKICNLLYSPVLGINWPRCTFYVINHRLNCAH
jgi:hypothetical protein